MFFTDVLYVTAVNYSGQCRQAGNPGRGNGEQLLMGTCSRQNYTEQVVYVPDNLFIRWKAYANESEVKDDRPPWAYCPLILESLCDIGAERLSDLTHIEILLGNHTPGSPQPFYKCPGWTERGSQGGRTLFKTAKQIRTGGSGFFISKEKSGLFLPPDI